MIRVGNMVTTGIPILLVPALMAVYLRASSRRGSAVATRPVGASTGAWALRPDSRFEPRGTSTSCWGKM